MWLWRIQDVKDTYVKNQVIKVGSNQTWLLSLSKDLDLERHESETV